MGKILPLQTATAQYAIVGALFGLSFPVIGTLLVIINNDLSWSFAGIISAQSLAAPLLYIIDTAPFFLGLFALLAGRKQDALREESAERIRLTEEIAKLSELNLAALLENTTDSVWSIDTNYKLIVTNTAFRQCSEWIFGTRLDSGSMFFDPSMPEELRKEFKRYFNRALRGEHFTVQMEAKAPSETVDFEISFNPIYKEDNEVVGATALCRNITERKRTEKQLQTITDSAQDAIVMMDHEGNISFWNPGAVEMFGYTQEEAIGGELHRLITPERFYQAYQNGFEQFKRTGQGAAIGQTLELAALHKDGHEFPIAISLSSFQKNGNWHAVGIIRDISDIKQTEEKLKKSEEQYRTIFESFQDLFYRTDIRGYVTLISPSVRQYGYEPEDIIGSPVTKFFLDPSERKPLMRRLIKDSVVKDYELQLKYKDGTVVDTSLTARMIADETGRPVGVEGVLRDITERKRAEEALKRTTEQMKAQYKYIPVPTFTWKRSGDDMELVDYNDEAEEITRGRVTGWIGMKANVMYEHLPDVLDDLRRCLQEEQTISREINYISRTTGETVFLAVKYAFVPPDMVMVHSEDITTHKQAVEEIKRSRAEAEAANQAKSDFLANMSHEIRTPMNGVIGMADLLLDTELTPEQREFTQTIRQSADSLLTVINDILDFSKIEAGKLELELIDFSLRTILEEIGDITAIRANQKGLEFVSIISPDVPSLLIGDPGRLRQILINLIGNAIKFTSEGEVVVKVDLEQESDSDVTLRFSIKDTGIGVTQDKVNSLFESFSQVDSSTTRRYGGTGLGLAISKRLSELMKGQIGVESTEGEGSTFWFTAVLGKQPVDRETDLDVKGDIRGKHILIVDDNDTNRLLLRELLRGWHCRYDEASEGKTALGKMRRAAEQHDPFDVALLDMLMPGMDGEMLGRKIKADPTIRDTVLVILTSLERSGDSAYFQKIGFDAYLTKPIKQSQLFDCLVTIFHPARLPVEARSRRTIVTKHTIDGDRRRKVRILVVEDNPTNQLVAKSILQKLGHSPDIASNGLEAVEAVGKKSYDLVLMDVQMPVMDGFEATQTIRGLDGPHCNVPIIAMTAHAMRGDREKCLDAGMDDYISKPIQAQELVVVVEKWLERSRMIRSASSEQSGGKVMISTAEKILFDRIALLDRVSGDEEIVKEILGLFAEDAHLQISILRDGLEKEDSELVMRQAHTLKSASGSVGAISMQNIAQRMEHLAQKSNLTPIRYLLEEIEREFEKLKEHLTGLGLLA